MFFHTYAYDMCIRVGAGIALQGLIIPVHRSEIMRMVSRSSILKLRATRTHRNANNSQNLPASRTQRTQGRNIPFGGTPRSDNHLPTPPCAGTAIKSYVCACECVGDGPRGSRIGDARSFRIEDCETMRMISLLCTCVISP